jgi:hypothetical protein
MKYLRTKDKSPIQRRSILIVSGVNRILGEGPEYTFGQWSKAIAFVRRQLKIWDRVVKL